MSLPLTLASPLLKLHLVPSHQITARPVYLFQSILTREMFLTSWGNTAAQAVSILLGPRSGVSPPPLVYVNALQYFQGAGELISRVTVPRQSPLLTIICARHFPKLPGERNT